MKFRKSILITAVLAVIFFTHDGVARLLLKALVSSRTGCPVQVGKTEVGLGSCSLAVQDLRLAPPGDATGDRLLELDHLYINARLWPLLTKKLRAQSMSVDLSYLHFIRNADGSTNLDQIAGRLLSGKQQPAAVSPSPPARPKRANQQPSWVIDTLELHIGQIQVTDYARGSTPTQLTLTLNTRRTYHNISSIDQVLQPLKEEFLGGIPGQNF